MAVKTRPYDIAAHLDRPERVEAYLNAVFEDGDPDEVAEALEDVVRARRVHDGRLNPTEVAPAVAEAWSRLGAALDALGSSGLRLRVAVV